MSHRNGKACRKSKKKAESVGGLALLPGLQAASGDVRCCVYGYGLYAGEGFMCHPILLCKDLLSVWHYVPK